MSSTYSLFFCDEGCHGTQKCTCTDEKWKSEYSAFPRYVNFTEYINYVSFGNSEKDSPGSAREL